MTTGPDDVTRVTLPDPPPDPAVMVTHAMRDRAYPLYAEDPFPSDEVDDRMVDAVRDLFTPEALAAAAAKVQEVQP